MQKEEKYKKKDRKDMIQYINLQLAALGQPLFHDNADAKTKYSNARFISLTDDLIKSFKEKTRLLSDHLSPVDQRIQNFLDDYLKEVAFDKLVYKNANNDIREIISIVYRYMQESLVGNDSDQTGSER